MMNVPRARNRGKASLVGVKVGLWVGSVNTNLENNARQDRIAEATAGDRATTPIIISESESSS